MDMQVCTDALRAEVRVSGGPSLTRLPGGLEALGDLRQAGTLQRML
jgi:hypothetical protein